MYASMLLLQHAQQKHLFWGDVKYLVLDEADTMFDKGFGPEVKQILGPLRNRGGDLQVVLVTATLTKVGVMANAMRWFCP